MIIFYIKSFSYESDIKNVSSRITEAYRVGLGMTFNHFKEAKHVIILEDDLLVAPDFFRYFLFIVMLQYCNASRDLLLYNISKVSSVAIFILICLRSLPFMNWKFSNFFHFVRKSVLKSMIVDCQGRERP